MARGRFAHTPTPQRPVRPRTVISSAARVRRDQYRVVFTDRPQAAEAWKYYTLCGVIRFGVNWLASACSRARLYIGRIDPDGAGDPEPVDDPRIQAVINTFAGGQTGQSQLIQRMIIHEQVVGESFLVNVADPDTGEQRWVAATAREVERKGDEVFYLFDEKTRVPLKEDDVLRIWRPDPACAWLPISTVGGLLDEARQLCALNAHVLATADSRLAGNGILTVPESATIAAATQAGEQQLLDDPFMNEFTEALMTPLNDRSSAAAVVPVVIRVPDASVAGIKHITVATPFDAQVPDLIESVTKKIALGLDAPQEKILGVGETNHWNTEAIDADSVRVHVEPNLQVITSGLTAKWLPAAMEAAGLAYDPSLVVAADVSDLTQEPDRTETAIELFKLNAISTEALLRITGFPDTAAPTVEQLRNQLMIGLASTPQGAEMVASLLGLNTGQGDATVRQSQPLPTTPAPDEEDQDEDQPAPPALSAAAGPNWAELAVLRALELAGKRLLTPTARGRYRDVQPWALHTRLRASIADLDRLMDGAWDQLAELRTPPAVVAALDTYTRGLIATGRPHTADRLRTVLEAAATRAA